jgi:hypothetical protein
MRRLFLVASLVLAAALAAVVPDLGIRRSVYLGVATALWPIEPDTRERALIIAAGAGQVSNVQALLAEGVRPEPETLNAAVTGVFEPFYSWSGCSRHAAVTRMLLDANPRIRPANNARGRAVRTAAWMRRCPEVYRLIAN